MFDPRDEFFKICEREFQFLVEEFGFKKRAKKTDAGTFRTSYENSTTLVGVGLEWREQYLYVLLGRRDQKKEPGRMPHPDDELAVFNLEDLLTLRVPGHVVRSGDFRKTLTRQDVERVLREYASALREHAADILRGDFKSFPELEKIVRKRMTDYASE